MSNICISNNNQNIGFSINAEDNLQLLVPKFIKNIEKIKEDEYFKFYRMLKMYKDKANQKSVKERDYYKTPTTKKTIDFSRYTLIELYFSLMEDYKKNNILLFKKLNTNLQNRGRINWIKSMNKNCELIFGESIIYSKYFYNNLIFDYNNILSILYCSEILRTSKLLDCTVSIPYSENSLKKFNSLVKDKMAILNSLRHTIYSDREIIVFNILYNIFNYEDQQLKVKYKESNKLLYVEKFDSVWEEMLRVTLSSEICIYNKFFLTGSYYLFDKEIDKAKYQPRLDIVIEEKFNNNSYLIILDAKNYIIIDSNNIDSLPATESLSKQYLYKYFLSTENGLTKLYDKRNIVNAFLFPSVLGDKAIDYIGYYRFREKFNIYEDILCFQIDFYRLREAYLNHCVDYRSKVLTYIIKKFINLRQ